MASLDHFVQVFDELLCLRDSDLGLIHFSAFLQLFRYIEKQLDAGLAHDEVSNDFKGFVSGAVTRVGVFKILVNDLCRR